MIIAEMEVAMAYLSRCAAVLLLSFASPVLAQTADEAAISKLLHTTFDRPEARLTIAPVVVAGSNAIAGWAQGETGGRALLRKKGESWQLILCAGDGIKSRDALAKAGVPAHDAAALERDLAAAESNLPAQHVAMLSRFEGMLMMDASGHHPPVGHAASPGH
jgi:hypothetical protein